jgi:hypothetical protein
VSKDETWDIAVNLEAREFRELDSVLLTKVDEIIREVLSVKIEITSIFDELNGGEICRQCLGECCQTGCYHFTAVDLLAYLVTGRELFVPRFDNGACPYLGDAGCLMEPCYRPYNCVTFVCEGIDAGMNSAARGRFAELSMGLIGLYQKLERLFANRFVYGILNNGTRFVEGRSKGILWSGNGNN